MKRPPQNLVFRAPSRRHRALSDEERALWDAVSRQFKPLRTHHPATPQVSPHPGTSSVKPSARAKQLAIAPQTRPSKPPIPPLSPIGRRERTRLSRGRAEIEARLDLHGMTQMRAHHALVSFLQRAHHEGLGFVLVITGKGNRGNEAGVLRQQVPQWLSLPELRPYVVGFEEAHAAHGGGGALYVRIRRAR